MNMRAFVHTTPCLRIIMRGAARAAHAHWACQHAVARSQCMLAKHVQEHVVTMA